MTDLITRQLEIEKELQAVKKNRVSLEKDITLVTKATDKEMSKSNKLITDGTIKNIDNIRLEFLDLGNEINSFEFQGLYSKDLSAVDIGNLETFNNLSDERYRKLELERQFKATLNKAERIYLLTQCVIMVI